MFARKMLANVWRILVVAAVFAFLAPAFGSPTAELLRGQNDTSTTRPPRTASTQSDVSTRLKGAANKLGLNFLVSFAESVMPALADVFEDAPVAAEYIARLLSRGLDPNLADPEGPVAESLYDILQTMFDKIATTRTGNIAMERMMFQLDFNITNLAAARDFREMLHILKKSDWSYYPWWHTGTVTGANNIVYVAATTVQALVAESLGLHYWSYSTVLTPYTVAADSADFLLAVAESTLSHADTLRTSADASLLMTVEEYDAFSRLRASAAELQRSLEGITAELDGRESKARAMVKPPPPSPPPWWWQYNQPSPPPWWSNYPSNPPQTPPQPPSPPSIRADKVAVRILNSLGLQYLLRFAEDTYVVALDIAYYVPNAAKYIYRLVDVGPGSLLDVDGGVAYALHRIVQTSVNSWTNSTTGSIIADFLLQSHNVDLYALGAASDLLEVVDIMKRSFWNPYHNEADYGPTDVVNTVAGIIRTLVMEATTPNGRVGPIEIALDAVDFAKAFVGSVVDNAYTLRYSADGSLRMTDDEYEAFYMIRTSLDDLRGALGRLRDGITNGGGGADNGEYDYGYRRPRSSPSPPPPWWSGYDTVPPPPSGSSRPPWPPQPLRPPWGWSDYRSSPPPPSGPSWPPWPWWSEYDTVSPPSESPQPPWRWSDYRSSPPPPWWYSSPPPPSGPSWPPWRPQQPSGPSWPQWPPQQPSGSSASPPPWWWQYYSSPPPPSGSSASPPPWWWQYYSSPPPPSGSSASPPPWWWQYYSSPPPPSGSSASPPPWWWQYYSSPPPPSGSSASPPPWWWQYYSSPPPPSGSSASPPPWWWYSSPPPPLASPGGTEGPLAALERLVRTLTYNANKMGLHFLLRFVETAYPPAAEIGKDLPTAAWYVYKLLQQGLGPFLSDPSSQAAYSLYRILQAAFANLASTPSGSIIADVALRNHDIDLVALASARDFSDLISSFKSASWGSDGSWEVEGIALVAQSITDSVQELLWNAVSPYGRMGPVQLARDVVSFVRAVVGATLDNADELRNNADAQMFMSNMEYDAFLRLQHNLDELNQNLSYLAEELNGIVGDYGTAEHVRHPPTIRHPPRRLSPPAESSGDVADLGGIILRAANNLGLDFLVAFGQSAYPAVNNALLQAPLVAQYIRRLLRHGLDPSFTDPSGPTAEAVFNILHPTFSRLLETDTGSIVADYLVGHELDLQRIATARNFTELIGELRHAYWWQRVYDFYFRQYDTSASLAQEGAASIVDTVTNIVRHIVRDAVLPYGRISPQVLASDIVEVTLTLTRATIRNMAQLRGAAEHSLYLSDLEMNAFYALQYHHEACSLTILRESLINLAASLNQ
ncbi:hypothetical protein VOLCADRAFT_108121 [Volvox carteri f. nagariensis]|uniref:Uncharacterized protein n=1 Tax=Volvox carteri f. nagariensis TaxID=3068 RepID=D8UIC6_VOLCA|nr:uncharacterized protein VOLCADRAFT_108121 [Volvox carteri f. nagariensis]EFJ40562.1 hypothetical protein VOLCADRAFT_108121 [Volvox carteri f. nagariensis]|eukprot:XP_002958412.1 hypothetical protein VOLCADRAFT_108121 [Volvox carteri f. nagariensis]